MSGDAQKVVNTLEVALAVRRGPLASPRKWSRSGHARFGAASSLGCPTWGQHEVVTILNFSDVLLSLFHFEREREKAEVKEKKHHNGRRQLGADVDSPWWCEKNILKRSIKAGNSLRREKTHARRKITKICLCFTIMAVWFFNIENISIIYSTKRANCYSHQFVKK